MQMQEKKIKGFSVLELIVVITIIAVISTVSFTPFQKWRSDRLVRSEATNLSVLIRDIFSQVQRGQYGFVQFEIIKDGDSGKYSVSSNGMKTTNFMAMVRNKYDGDTLRPFHNYEDRCDMSEPELSWDHQGSVDKDVLTVNEIFIDTNDVELGITGKAEIPDEGGRVCFSKDGTFYSPGGAFVEGTGDSVTTIEEFYICSAKSDIPSCTMGGEGPNQNNFFKIEWSRFGNISLKKWANGQWVIQ